MKKILFAVVLIAAGVLMYIHAEKNYVDARIKAELLFPESYYPTYYERITSGAVVLYLCSDYKGDTIPCMDTVQFTNLFSLTER
jgi:hypothetical protein